MELAKRMKCQKKESATPHLSNDDTGYAETFESLCVEVDLLSDTYKCVYDQFDEYKVF